MAARIDPGDEIGETHEINVTPFIDVMLVLLIIFMIAAPLSTVDVAVDLPTSSAQSNPPPEKPVTLTLKSDLSLLVDGQQLSRSNLAAALDRASNGDRTRRVFLHADKSVAYGEVMALMDDLRAAGYLKVGLVGIESDKPK
jgi:biopolymer transport protein ExbD